MGAAMGHPKWFATFCALVWVFLLMGMRMRGGLRETV